MIDGRVVKLANASYLIPPLTIQQFTKLRAKIERVGALNQQPVALHPDHLPLVLEIVSIAMRRNYPAMYQFDVSKVMDLGNATAALMAALAIEPAAETVPDTVPATEIPAAAD